MRPIWRVLVGGPKVLATNRTVAPDTTQSPSGCTSQRPQCTAGGPEVLLMNSAELNNHVRRITWCMQVYPVVSVPSYFSRDFQEQNA